MNRRAGYWIVGLLVGACMLAGLLPLARSIPMGSMNPMLRGNDHTEEPEEGPLNELAQALQVRQAELQQREIDLDQRASLLDQRERALARTREQIEAVAQSTGASLALLETDQAEKLEEVVKTVEAMRPANAVQHLAAMPQDEASAILRLMRGRDRARVLGAMAPEQSVLFLRTLRDEP